jgi:bacillithiol synthase
MQCNNSTLPYKDTGYFSKIVTDYLDQSDGLRPFYQYPYSLDGIKDSIAARNSFKTNRPLLVEVLKQQYASLSVSEAVNNNISLLLQDNCYTITTAHQPAIFTGTLYFVYKILHTIKLAAFLKEQFPLNEFVPVFYMGSEDADLDELGKIFMDGEKIEWEARQKGAVGRMKPKGLEKIITRLEGELSVQPYGKELIQLLKECYLNSPDIQTATFKLIHALFAEYGLLVVIPDNAKLKKVMTSVFRDDLLNQSASAIVDKTINELSKHYKVQANPRAINLFYLKDDIRGRIEKVKDEYIVHESSIKFSEKETLDELVQFPERFSPNVILRGLFQESILPNIAFIGGGGELAYWLELKSLFEANKVPYPVLVLRNSLLVIEDKWKEKIEKLGFTSHDFFQTEQALLTQLVSRNKNGELKLQVELSELEKLYNQLKAKALQIDKTLERHVDALRAKTTKPLHELEKKMLRAEKRKYESELRQIHAVKTALFPLNNLQERIDNFMPYYAKWGKSFIDMLFQHSPALGNEFVVLEEM